MKILLIWRPYSKEIDAYITKIKQDYQNHIQGGGLEEWKEQNAKIINNGMIMAEDRAVYEQLDKSRASTIEPGSSLGSKDLLKTPRPTPSMFTAINRHHEGSGPTPRTERGPGSGHPSPMHMHDPLSSGGDLAAHMMGEGGVLNVMEHLNEWEGTRIADCLGDVGGDIQGFSYGDVPDSNLLFGQWPRDLESIVR